MEAIMGFRFRKSIRIGKNFRINLSKSGIGYSVGGNGFRATQTAQGKTRTTASIPGTGISYTNEFGNSNQNSSPSNNPPSQKSTPSPHTPERYESTELKNEDIANSSSEGLEELIASARKALILRRLFLIFFLATLALGFQYPVFLIFSAISFIAFLIVKAKGTINLEYSFDESLEEEVNKRMAPLLKIAKSQKIWGITQTSKVDDTKYNSGAENVVKRVKGKALDGIPFPFNTTSTCVAFSIGKEKIIFLPDKLFIIQGTTVGAFNYSDITTEVCGKKFVETEQVPSDTKIIDHTWKYTNQSGGPDKRFQDNPRLPVCLYGKLSITSKNGSVNTTILFSNPNIE